MKNVLSNIDQLGTICDSLSGLSEGERVRRTKSGTFEAPGRWAQTKHARANGKPNFLYRFVQWLSLLTRGYTAKKCDRMFTAFQKECSAPLASLYLLVDTNREHFTDAEKQKIDESLTALKTKIGAARKGIDTLGATYAKKTKRYQIVLKTLGVLNATLAEQEALTDRIKGLLFAAPAPILPNAVVIPPLPLPPPVTPLNRHQPEQQPESLPLPIAPTEAETVLPPTVTPNLSSPPPPPPSGAGVVRRNLLQQFSNEPTTPSANARDLLLYKSLPRDMIAEHIQELKTSIDFCRPLIEKYDKRFKEYEDDKKMLNDIVKAKDDKLLSLERNRANLEQMLYHQKDNSPITLHIVEKSGSFNVLFCPDEMADAFNQRIEGLKLDPSIAKGDLNRIEDNQKFSLAIPELTRIIDEENIPVITAYTDQEKALRANLEKIESKKRLHGMNFKDFKDYIDKKRSELNAWKRIYNAKSDFIQNGERKVKGKTAAAPVEQNALAKKLEKEPELLKALQDQAGIKPMFRATVLRRGGSMNALFERAQSPQR